ncbi:MAG TPA: BNR repeat-containing protein [Streptosporangiaceae bacterium]|jgi:hypothetical protein
MATARRTPAIVAALIMLLGLAQGTATADAKRVEPTATVLRDTLLDSSAIYFVSYDGLVNNNPFQQSGIFAYGRYQYAAWYRSDRYAVIARRQVPAGRWEMITLPHRLSTDDSHNVISMAVSPRDGRLHIAMDTHNTPIYYTKSEPGLATRPGPWEVSRFGPIQHTLDGIDLGGISYPQFVVTPDRRLQFSYRTGGSGNGTNELAEYSAGTWTRLGKWSGATGTYTNPANGVVSPTRNMYLHGITYGRNGRLYAAFTWREGNQAVLCAPGGLDNHDTGYVYSDDQGRTWRNNAGEQVGTTGGQLVSIDSPGLVVDPLGVDRGLMNQESQAIDAHGQPHVIISYVPEESKPCVTSYQADRTAYGRAYHLFRDHKGGWHKTQIPEPLNAVGRSRIVLDRHDNAYVIMPYGRIVAASKASGWTDWKVLFDPPVGPGGLNAFGEVDVDDSRLATAGVLSFMYQQKSTGTTPSPIRVIDFKLGE